MTRFHHRFLHSEGKSKEDPAHSPMPRRPVEKEVEDGRHSENATSLEGTADDVQVNVPLHERNVKFERIPDSLSEAEDRRPRPLVTVEDANNDSVCGATRGSSTEPDGLEDRTFRRAANSNSFSTGKASASAVANPVFNDEMLFAFTSRAFQDDGISGISMIVEPLLIPLAEIKRRLEAQLAISASKLDSLHFLNEPQQSLIRHHVSFLGA